MHLRERACRGPAGRVARDAAADGDPVRAGRRFPGRRRVGQRRPRRGGDVRRGERIAVGGHPERRSPSRRADANARADPPPDRERGERRMARDARSSVRASARFPRRWPTRCISRSASPSGRGGDGSRSARSSRRSRTPSRAAAADHPQRVEHQRRQVARTDRARGTDADRDRGGSQRQPHTARSRWASSPPPSRS